jgi:Ca2+-binding RTX toxin-like protein
MRRRGRSSTRASGGIAAILALGVGVGLVTVSTKAEAAFPGTNGKIVFMGSRNGGDYDVLAINADGTGLTDLTANSALDSHPDVSPDGTKIAFSSNSDGDYEIYTMNADGSGLTQVTHNSSFDVQPSWSPDGTKIAFSRDGNTLHVINADGSGEQMVEPGPNSETPEWSPDGTKLVFEANRSNNVDIFAVNATGGGLTRLTADPKRDLLPDWSPDGSKIAFVSDRVCNPFCYSQIWVMSADGTGQTALTATAPAQNEWPAWSPDGSRIAFSRSNATGSWDLYLMDADGSGQVLLTTGGTFNTHPDWGPAHLEITGVVEEAETVPRYQRFEASIALSETFVNPFDPDEIAVDVTFTAPTGRAQVVPAFWYEPYTVAGSPDWEQYQSAGSAGWRVRFAPDEVGTYSYSVSAAAGSRIAAAVSGSFQSVASGHEGFVRPDAGNSRYLRFDSGDPYIPVGHNLAFEEGGPPLNGVGYYTEFLSSLGSAGENWTRVWMTDFNRSALEWGEGHYSGLYHGPGVYSLPSAWRMDRILEQAEANGVYVQLVLADHGQVSTRGGDRWGVRCALSDTPPCEPGDVGYDPGNAYSDYNGGPIPLAQPDLFFSNAEARDLMKKRLRYIVARWGAFRSVLAWELMNEFLYVGSDSTNPFTSPQLRSDIVDWHADLAQYLKTNDPFGHLVTTSQAIQEEAGAIADLNAIWALAAIDLVQIHWYVTGPERMNADLDAMIDQFKARYEKPVLVGELGLPAYPNPDPPPPDFVNPERVGAGDLFGGFDPLGFVRAGNADFGPENKDHLVAGTHLHNAMWAAAVAESGAMYWWWGTYIAADASRNRIGPSFPLNERLVPPLNAYLAGEDLATLGLDDVTISTSGPVVAVGSGSSTHAFVWVRDAENEYGTGSRPGDLAGRSISGASIGIPGLDDGNYRVRVFDTWSTGAVTSTFTASAVGGTLVVNLPSFTRDIALKVDPTSGPSDADGDGVDDTVDPDGGDGSSPPGAFADDTGDGSTTTGTVVSGTATVADVADPKGVRITAVTDAVVSVCAQGFELEVPAGVSLTVTCASLTVEAVTGGAGAAVTVRIPGVAAAVVFPAGTSGTVNRIQAGRATITGVTGEGVIIVVGSVVVPLSAGSNVTLITGGIGDDRITGTGGDDVIVDAAGNNTIDGRGGNDTIMTGPGTDKVTGGTGDDTIEAGNGNNVVTGSGGNDEITTGSGADKITGDAGADAIDAGDGNNVVTGGASNDSITTGSGNDTIDGGAGFDTCRPGAGTNKVKNCEA